MARLEDLVAAYSDQQTNLAAWLEGLEPSVWDQPSRLEEWSVCDLAFHTTDQTAVVVLALEGGPSDAAPLSLAVYTGAFRAAAGEIAARSRDAAKNLDRAAVLANAALARSTLLDALATVSGDPVVAGRRGPIRLTDLLITRINELVVHSLDLSASVPSVAPVDLDRAALGVSCRMLAGILAERVPGHTVEVRVPPYAAVQCVDGPRHTRGTPPNVIETDPLTWIGLATGRSAWAEALASGRVRASGERADLAPYLPVLA